MINGNQNIQRKGNKSCHNNNAKSLQVSSKNQSLPDFDPHKFDRISLDILNPKKNSKAKLSNQKTQQPLEIC